MDKFIELNKYIFAHRGFHDKPQIAENSMTAFKRAKDRGWGAELDIHLMKDGNLAVIHDASLKRTAGANLLIEDLSKEDLDKYVLEDSDDHIPLFEEVLALKLPLIVELKVERGNYEELGKAAWERLKDYDAPWCMESFDPRAVLWFKKNHPEVCRGQLAENFYIDSEVELPGYQKFLLYRLMFNIITKPDFIAYKFEHRDNKYLKRYLSRGVKEASWTIRDKETFDKVLANNSIPIFERFDPEE